MLDAMLRAAVKQRMLAPPSSLQLRQFSIARNILIRKHIFSPEGKIACPIFPQASLINRSFSQSSFQASSLEQEAYVQGMIKHAETGDISAQNKVGDLYMMGIGGLEKNTEKASEWYLKAANQGCKVSQFRLGVIHYSPATDEGVVDSAIPISNNLHDLNNAKAWEWFTKSADQNYPNAYVGLAEMLEKGNGVQQDYTKAFEWYLKAADQSNVYAEDQMRRIIKYVMAPTELTIESVFNFFLNIATKNQSPYAQTEVEWFLKAADQGYPEAQDKLGVMYETGVADKDGFFLIDQNYERASEWYLKAAHQHHMSAQYNLAVMYDLGLGVAKSDTEAFQWYMKAAHQGHAKSQGNVAIMFQKGEGGVEKNYREAVSWFTKSARQGNPNAQHNLGLIFLTGEGGVEQNDKVAFELFQLAAKQGSMLSQYQLGRCYQVGIGVDENHETSFEWYFKAADQGYAPAQDMISQLCKQHPQEHVEWLKKVRHLKK